MGELSIDGNVNVDGIYIVIVYDFEYRHRLNELGR